MDNVFPIKDRMGSFGDYQHPERRPPQTIKQDEVIQSQLLDFPRQQPQGLQQQLMNVQIDKLSQEVRELNKTIIKSNSIPTIISDRIYSLPSEKYAIIQPINILVKIFSDEVLTIIPELEIYGEGKTEMDSIYDLKLELIDLLEDLENTPKDQLGKNPMSWKKALNQMVKVCR